MTTQADAVVETAAGPPPPDLGPRASLQVLRVRTLGTLVANRIPAGADWVDETSLARGRSLLATTAVHHARQRSVNTCLADGRRLRAPVPKGDYAFPHRDGLTEAQARDKFTRLVGAVLGVDAAERIAAGVLCGAGDLPLAELTRWIRR